MPNSDDAAFQGGNFRTSGPSTEVEEEKNEPNILKSERIRRIARGSGVKEKNVRELLAQWNRSRKMMKGIKGNRKLRRQMKGMMGDMDDMDMPM